MPPDATPPPQMRPLSAETYAELKVAARAALRGAKGPGAMDATSLAHMAYGRLAPKTQSQWKTKSHFLAAAAKAMRHIIIDHVRQEKALKRGGDLERQSISVVDLYKTPKDVDALNLHDLLERLEKLDPRQAHIVEMKFFGGCTMEEISEEFGISKTTVESEWRHARAWIRAHLDDGGDGTGSGVPAKR